MKRCCICGIIKDFESFNKNATRKDGFQVQCRDCGKETSKQYHKENKAAHTKVCARRSKEVRQRNKEQVVKYLLVHPCVDCGESDLVVLDFDHVRGKKFKNVSVMVNQGYSWSAILAEIKKCDVRCANDHRRITEKRRLSNAGVSGSISRF
jgi:hypothetical protein